MDKITFVYFLKILATKAWQDALAIRGVSLAFFILGILDFVVLLILSVGFFKNLFTKEDATNKLKDMLVSAIGLVIIFICAYFHSAFSLYHTDQQTINAQGVSVINLKNEIKNRPSKIIIKTELISSDSPNALTTEKIRTEKKEALDALSRFWETGDHIKGECTDPNNQYSHETFEKDYADWMQNTFEFLENNKYFGHSCAVEFSRFDEEPEKREQMPGYTPPNNAYAFPDIARRLQQLQFILEREQK
jgi:hypothetical protein